MNFVNTFEFAILLHSTEPQMIRINRFKADSEFFLQICSFTVYFSCFETVEDKSASREFFNVLQADM